MLAACIAVALASFLALAAPVFAATAVNQRPLLFSFDGSDTTAGKFDSAPTGPFFGGVGALALDESTGGVYAIDGHAEAIDKFDPEGVAVAFAAGPAAGTSSLLGPTAGETFAAQNQFFFEGLSSLAVDNSGGLGGVVEGEQGRLYVGGSRGPIHAFDREGNFLWTLPREAAGQEITNGTCGMTVDAQGHLWVGVGEQTDKGTREKVLEFDTTGAGPPSTTPIAEVPITSGTKLPCGVGIDQTGKTLYVAHQFNAGGSPAPSLDKYLDGVFDAIVTNAPTRAVAVDQAKATGNVFAVTQPGFQDLESTLDEYEPCSTGCGGTLLSSSSPGLIGDGRGVAYNPVRDWLYIADHYTQTVKVFGRRASGPVPQVSEGETDEITKTEATARGTVNPGGLPNTYHFEWVRAEIQRLVVNSKGGMFWLGTRNFNRSDVSDPPEGLMVTKPMPFDVSPGAMQAELEAIFGAGNVAVTGTPATGSAPGEYRVLFKEALAGRYVHALVGIFREAFEEEAGGYKGGPSPGANVQITRVSQGQLWAAAEPQPTWPESNPSIEPTDSVDHAVSRHLTGLRTNTTYHVRLVGANTEAEGDPEKRLDAYSTVDTFTTLPPPLPSVSGLSVSGITTESAHLSATVDPQEDETIWRALVSTEAPPGASQAECEALGPLAFEVAREGTIPPGEPGAVNVEGDLTGLEHGQTYCVRLVATNGGGSASADAVFSTDAVKPTEAKLAFAAPRTDTAARLNAYVNPEGETPLTYRFEYSTDGVSWTVLPDRVSSIEAHRQIVLAQEATGLTPQTTYFYRLGLVTNEAGEVPKTSLPAKKAFTTRTTTEMTLPSNALGEPEKRGSELVNTPDKGNQHVIVLGFGSGSDVPVAPDGNKMIWTLAGGAPEGTSGVYNAFLATRSQTGWTSRGLLPPAEEQVGGGNLKYRADFASTDFTHFIFRTEGGLFPGENPQSTYVRLDANRHQEVLAHFDANRFSTSVDVTADTAHVLHNGEDTNLLEDIGTGTPEVVGLMAGGSPPACGIHYDTEFRGPNSAYAYPGYQWISSTDASRVYFQTRGSNCSGSKGLYLRNRDAGTTTQIAQDASFIRASTDGRSGFFTTLEALAGNDKNSDLDIYKWTEGAGAKCLTCVVADANVSPLPRGVRISDDFSSVYFLSTSQLISGLGKPGELNLYVLSGGSLRFVTDPNDPNLLSGPGQMEMSGDGNIVVFSSSAQLTADRIASSCVNANDKAPHPCNELYRYDDHDGSLECVSCLHDGTTTGEVFTENNNGGQPFRISRDGSTVAFTTAQALMPADVNGGYDVYEWRNGAVRLITDGETRFPTGLAAPDLAGVDANGENVFFVLADPGLTGYERDGVDNVYDARIGGGFPRPSPAVHCADEACQGPLQGTPKAERPASFGFSGRGNISTPRRSCRKGKVRRHGRCVSRQSHKGRHKRASHAKAGRTR